MAELDLARSVLAKEESEWVRSADRAQEAQRNAEEAAAALEELKAEQAPKREEIAAKQVESDDKLQAAGAERDEAARGLDAAMLLLLFFLSQKMSLIL